MLGELQDRLAPFSSAVAYALIEEELGQPVDAVFEQLSPEPVAAASLGQARCEPEAILLLPRSASALNRRSGVKLAPLWLISGHAERMLRPN